MSEEKQSSESNSDLKQRLASLYSYLSKHLGIKQVPKVVFTKDKKNAEDPFGMTGHYNQEDNSIHIHILDRHDTDILRTFAHETIHHWQRERGTLSPQNGESSGHYAQEDPNLRRREIEAYMLGNILFRDWQDENRMGPPKVQPFLPQPLDENLNLDGNKLKQDVTQFVNKLVLDGGLSSYHRERTSGDMNPQDFTNDLVHDILSTIEQWVQTVNNRGDWENQEGGMIK